MKEAFEKKYHDVEKSHFWFLARRNYIKQLLKEAPKDSSVLDIGCSSGILLNELKDMGFNTENLYGVDISEVAIKNCKQNGLKHVFVMDGQAILLNRTFDYIIASDCLEHMEQEQNALQNWHSLLTPMTGKLLLFVPAFMMLWSPHDEVNNHYRRYTRSDLKQKMKANGFKIHKASYWNFLLFPPVLIVRLLSRLSKKKEVPIEGDLRRMSQFNKLLYHILAIDNTLLSFINLPFGISTFCIASKAE